MTATIEGAIAERRCNGCGLPAAKWGPVCGGMTQGDWTHFHSPEWWRSRAGNERCAERSTPEHAERSANTPNGCHGLAEGQGDS